MCLKKESDIQLTLGSLLIFITTRWPKKIVSDGNGGRKNAINKYRGSDVFKK